MKSFFHRLSLGLLFLQYFAATVAKQVTYGKYGTFSDGAPFDSKVIIVKRPLPDPPERMETTFFLYTREDRIGYKTLDDSDLNKLKESNYDGSRKTILIAHGWTGKPLESVWVKDMKDALLEKENVNVIVVGWKEGADDLYYPQAVGNTRLVGAMVAEFIKFLITQKHTKTSADMFHMIGFSLGGQVAGYAGKRFHEITGSKIARITGLDPASPGYKGTHIDVRLDATDAEFVDVIHSDSPRIGTPDKSGKLDFWPNGGGSQPGCLIKKRGLIDKITKLVGCEHYRAHQYFIESIKSTECLFRSYPCASWNEFRRGKCMECGANGKNCPEMGFNAIKYKDVKNGNFYLYTSDKPPYCVPRYMYVRFQTGTRSGWGMFEVKGDDPKIRVNGAKGTTGEIEFDGHLDEGSTEQFIAPIKSDLGELQTIEIKDGKLLALIDPWKVVKVTVQYVGSKQSYYACYNTNVNRSFKKKPLSIGNDQCAQKDLTRPFLDRPCPSGSKCPGQTVILKLEIEPSK
ncbi:inactive pancreatic lipase-related protein 1 [Exaiptasia diaphana]|uniref:PLAT domain-containing protein n=1 Tax=Exaiptasia diaphana TaxID=2652724 RepID=A0A913X1M5_EXADI|nr:inactive pancreatic lipase-related protein 1 [Exaiptasia diaphana]